MKIGILETGLLPQELESAYGNYLNLFKILLENADGETETVSESEFINYRVIENVLPKSVAECDGWIITGSKHGVYETHNWIKPLEHFIQESVATKIPMVGICFGHQIMAQALGGHVEKFSGGWGVGLQEYQAEPSLFKDDKGDGDVKLLAFHQDQVIRPPEAVKVLMHSDFCQFAALAYGDKAISFQPHPEFSQDFVTQLTAARRGTVLPEAVADKALAILEKETLELDEKRVARNMIDTLRS